MNSPDQFVGGQFAWFTGVVEDIVDPLEQGRVRVRCFGYHNADLNELPVSALPWASVMMPITSASMSGIGTSATGVLQGSWVIGFFRDGPSAQDPIVLGTIPAISSKNSTGFGFADPKGTYPLAAFAGRPDTPAQSTTRYKDTGSYLERSGSRQLKVETAVPPKLETVSVPAPDSYYERKTWDEKDPKDHTSPVYPKCHSTVTESGHVFEVDDTPSRTRILQQHTSGTYEEWTGNGDRTVHVKGDNYEVIVGKNNVYIKGSCNLTIDGDLRTLVKGNYHLEVEKDFTQNVKGSIQTKIGGSQETEVQFTQSTNLGKSQILRVSENQTITVGGDRSVTVSGNLGQTVVGDSSYTNNGTKSEIYQKDLAIVSTGKLFLTAKTGVQIETPGDITVKTDGNLTETIVGNQDTTVTGNVTINGAIIDLNP